MAARCADELRGLGFSVRFDDSAAQTGADTGNLVAHLPGTAPGHVVLSAHMDTVQPCAGIEPVVEDGVVRSAGDTILSADDKAGIAAILEGVRSVVEGGAPRPDVTVLLTTCEEQHLLGSGALAPDALPAGAPCYVLDADGAPGTVITGAPCHWTLEAAFVGRASHAGVVPEAGVSAIQMAAASIEAMPLGRLDEAQASCDPKRLEQAIGNLLANAAKYAPGADVEVEGVLDTAARAYRVRVRDRGPGIPPEDLPFVADRFYRGSNAGDAPGAGLGLFIVRYLVEQMGGGLSLENAEPGLAAVLELPLAS